MPKTKISEFSATPANNTDIDSINIAEGCAPSGINDAIRELMAQLKDFQTGAVGDSFNGPVGTTTPAAGAFTTLSASSTATLSGLTASTALALDASKNIVSVTNTGTGSNVLATSPTLVTPILGTPTSATLTNATGLPISTGVSGLGTGVATLLATPSSANLASAITDETGSGSLVFATSPTLVTPILGTPTSATLTNATGLPIATGVSGLGTGVATFLATPSSANLAAALTDETGSGANVFATSPTLVTPILGTPTSATLTNATGLPLTTGVTGTLPTANGGTNLTSFTSGGVVYASSSSALATGSALSFNGNDFFGGTNTYVTGRFYAQRSSSSLNLPIAGYTDGSAGAILTGAKGDIVGFGNAGGDGVIFANANTEQMRLTSTGLGIGTSSPSCLLDVTKAAGANFVATFQNTTAATPYCVFIKDAASSTAGYPLLAVTNSTGSATYFRVDSSVGTVGIGTTPNSSASDGVLKLSGGITFPATQSASSDANTLDDYEEGTWTPSYSGGVTGVTYGSVRNGYYRKIGSQVTIWFGIMTDGLTVTSSGLQITGLPFTSASGSGSNGTVALSNVTRWVSSPPVVGQIALSSTAIYLYNSINATGAGVDQVEVTTGNMSTGSGNRNLCFGTATYSA